MKQVDRVNYMGMSKAVLKESLIRHVTGESVYVADSALPADALVGLIYYSPHPHAVIESFDLEKARQAEGVHAVLSYLDIPGENQMGPVIHDEPCLAKDEVVFIGQGVFLIAARDEDSAREAAGKIEVSFKPLQAILTLEEAIEKNNFLHPPRRIECGDADRVLERSDFVIRGRLHTGGQDHWYLETQACLAVPGEGREMTLYSSTQHPSETQAIVAEVLGVAKKDITVEVRRLGGAFGGKETQANHYAAWAALLARATKKPVLIRLTREEDQKYTGKRHPSLSDYQAGIDKDGRIQALKVDLNLDAGSSTDLTMAILERALFHLDNAYYIPNFSVTGRTWKTNLPSNTAFRGFGGPQGMAVIETVVDRVARFLGKDAAEIRRLNFYGDNPGQLTPWGQQVGYNRLPVLYDRLVASSDYFARKAEVDRYNRHNEFFKKGIALTPVKFGISFTTTFLNQAGALVHVYNDGSILINHGGVEMGQGLNTKIHSIAAKEFGVDPGRIRISETNTNRVPNTSATAASSGTDMNGMAVKDAIDKLKSRLASFFARMCNEQKPGVSSQAVDMVFDNDTVFDRKHPERKIGFGDLVRKAYLGRISLSETGYYFTPGIWYDKEKGRGRPFHYFAFGMAVSEVRVEVLTGGYELLRTDILFDAGKSIHEGIDRGQIAGGFIQGLGWCTTEELRYGRDGRLLAFSPDTYKIPSVGDIPADFRIHLLDNVPNPNTIRQSKAVGEPPFMLAFSAWLAIKYAISAVGNHEVEPDFRIPATCENILKSIERLKKNSQAKA
jgi:xanthine dehydrogenase molybdopterin binding subunit